MLRASISAPRQRADARGDAEWPRQRQDRKMISPITNRWIAFESGANIPVEQRANLRQRLREGGGYFHRARGVIYRRRLARVRVDFFTRGESAPQESATPCPDIDKKFGGAIWREFGRPEMSRIERRDEAGDDPRASLPVGKTRAARHCDSDFFERRCAMPETPDIFPTPI